MGKFLVIALLSLVTILSAAPSIYNVKQVTTPPTIDGDLSDWSGTTYLLDTLHSDTNCFFRVFTANKSMYDLTVPWTSDAINGNLYMGWDQTKVYFAVEVFNDARYTGTTCAATCEAITINTGNGGRVNIKINNSLMTQGLQLSEHAVATKGDKNLPVYEASVNRTIFDRYNNGSFRVAIGFEEMSPSGTDTIVFYYMIFGGEYNGAKNDINGNPWDVSSKYPTYKLEGFSSVESKPVMAGNPELVASPNPFSPKTDISFNPGNNGQLQIIGLQGNIVRTFNVGKNDSKVSWNGTDGNGNSVSQGIYLVHLVRNGKTLKSRLMLVK